MDTYKLTISYDGTNYEGWQKQRRADSVTVQETIEGALSDLFGVTTKITGAGRTDSGVHALAQVASMRAETKIMPEKLLKAINVRLPEDIVITKVEKTYDNFHAQKDAKGKHYRYNVYQNPVARAIGRQYCAQMPYPLNEEKVRSACKLLEGTHDFSAFCASGSEVLTHERTVYKAELTRNGDWWIFDFYGNGFLRNMVRIMVGTILEIGNERLALECINEAFLKGERALLGKTAPAKGLWLMEVYY